MLSRDLRLVSVYCEFGIMLFYYSTLRTVSIYVARHLKKKGI